MGGMSAWVFVWLLTMGALIVFIWLALSTLNELIRPEKERDELWDEVYGVVAPALAEDRKDFANRYLELAYDSTADPVLRTSLALLRAERTLDRLNAIRCEQRARMRPPTRSEKWRAFWWGFTHPFTDVRKMRADQ